MVFGPPNVHIISLNWKHPKYSTALKSNLEYCILIKCENYSLSTADTAPGRQNGSTEGRMFSRANLTLMKFSGCGRLKNHFSTRFFHWLLLNVAEISTFPYVSDFTLLSVFLGLVIILLWAFSLKFMKLQGALYVYLLKRYREHQSEWLNIK